jgi:hypothetical protein
LEIQQSLNNLHSNAALGTNILEGHCGLDNVIKRKAAKNTIHNKSRKKGNRLSGNPLKMIGERERLRNSRFASGRSNVDN